MITPTIQADELFQAIRYAMVPNVADFFVSLRVKEE